LTIAAGGGAWGTRGTDASVVGVKLRIEFECQEFNHTSGCRISEAFAMQKSGSGLCQLSQAADDMARFLQGL